MLCVNEDELDYEEDGLLENDSQKETKNENVEDNLQKWCDDQFLDIELGEDEHLISSEATSETVSAEPKPTKTKPVSIGGDNEMVTEKGKNLTEKKIHPCENKRNEEKIKVANVKIRRKQSWSFRRSKRNKKTSVAPALMSIVQQNPWVHNSNVVDGSNVPQPPYPRINSQTVPFSSNFENRLLNNKNSLPSLMPQLQQEQFPFAWSNQWFMPLQKPQNHLMVNKFIPHSQFQINDAMKYLKTARDRMSLTPDNSLRSNFKPRNGSVGCRNTSNHGMAEHSPNIPKLLGNSISSFPFSYFKGTAGQVNFNAKTASGLKKGEKEKVELKKEARLRRFQTEEMAVGESERVPGSCNLNKRKEQKDWGLFFEEDYFQKMEEQKRQREKILELKEKQIEIRSLANGGGSKSGIPTMNKEFLLNKKNPFDTDSDLVQTFLMTKVKTEFGWSDLKGKFMENLMLDESCEGTEAVKPRVLRADPKDSVGLQLGKNGTDNVAFVRTVSKTYDELRLPKLKSQIPKMESLRPLVPLNRMLFSIEEMKKSEQPQTEASQLTGCVVKVLNIPQSTTTEDIHELCRPVGRALEVKLNIPKENSALIRFGKPSCADDFYSLYHGQKMQNYFLNVIVI